MSYRVKLEIFEGPLDLLLYLVKQNHLEITNISISQMTDQYLKYLELMQALDLEIAGEFLVMAATLMQIKSRMLLPPETMPLQEAEEPDPQQELIQRLLEYQRFKEAADQLAKMERERLTQFTRPVGSSGSELPSQDEEFIEASLFDLLTVFSLVMGEAVSRELVHEIIRDEFTMEEKAQEMRELIRESHRLNFTQLLKKARNRLEAVVTFLATLELIRLREVLVRQSQVFGEIWILRNSGEVELTT